MGRNYAEAKTLLSQSITGTSPVDSGILDIRHLNHAAFMIVVGAGLTATFAVMGSLDKKTWVDLIAGIPPVSGSAANLPVNLPDITFPFLKVTTTPSSGTGTVTITGSAKGG